MLFTPEVITGVENDLLNVPSDYTLYQNYPNPFNPSTTIKYSIPEAANVKLTVFNVLGEVVTELVNEFKSSGSYSLSWNPQSTLSSGVYLYKIQAVGSNGKEFVETKKMVFLK